MLSNVKFSFKVFNHAITLTKIKIFNNEVAYNPTDSLSLISVKSHQLQQCLENVFVSSNQCVVIYSENIIKSYTLDVSIQ